MEEYSYPMEPDFFYIDFIDIMEVLVHNKIKFNYKTDSEQQITFFILKA